jgi:hypothetical protein
MTTDDCESTDQRINCAPPRAPRRRVQRRRLQACLSAPFALRLTLPYNAAPAARPCCPLPPDLRLHYCEVVAKHRSEPLAILALFLWMARACHPQAHTHTLPHTPQTLTRACARAFARR